MPYLMHKIKARRRLIPPWAQGNKEVDLYAKQVGARQLWKEQEHETGM